MLRLWRERLLVALAPDALSWVRLGRGLKPEAYEKRIVALEAPAGGEPWQAALNAFRTQAETWRNDAVDISVVLSNPFVRYVLVPHSDNISGVAEELALAKIQFTRVHGEAAQDWDIRLSPAPRGSARLASAVDRALIDAIRASFPAGARARLSAVQPWLMSAFNTARAQIPDAGAWLLLIEPERTCAALIVGKSWRAVHNVKGQYEHPDAWAELLERQRWRIEIERMPETVLVQAPHGASAPSHSVGPWKAASLATPWPAGTAAARDERYSTALTAL